MSVHGRTQRALLLALAWCAALLAVVPADAGAASSILRPDAVGSTDGWYVDPSGSFGWQVLDDAVTAPAAPSTAGDHIASDVKNAWATVPFATRTLASGETVTRARMWVYAATGSQHSLRLELGTGSKQLATATVPANSAAGWWQVETPGPLTQAQIDGLYVYAALSSEPSSTVSSVYAAYVDLQTDAPPPAPAITSDPGAAGSDATPTWQFTADPGLGTECELRRDATVVSAWGPCLTPVTYDLVFQPDATYTFSVLARDSGGVASATVTDTYALDRLAPAAPVIDSAPATVSADDTPTYTFTAEIGARTQCRIDRGGVDVVAWADCTTPASFDLSAQTDGPLTFSARAIDAAGNVGAETTSTYTLDRVAPDAPTLTVEPPTKTSDATPTWEWAVDASLTYECRLDDDDDAVVVSDWASCTSPRTYDVSGHADGPFTFSVRARDAAGNVGPGAQSTVTTKRTPPGAPVIVNGPTGPSQDDEPGYAFSTDAATTTECRMERPGFVVSDWSPCVSPRVYDLRLHPDADYTFRVRATDTAGNQGPEATRAYTLDRVTPSAPVISGGPTGSSTDDTPSWTLSAEAGAALACRLERGTTVVSDWSACTSPFEPDLRGEANGTYTLLVRAADAAGNTSDVATASYTLDRDVPLAPSFTATPPSPGHDATPSWSFTTSEAARTFECRVRRDGVAWRLWAACVSPYELSLGAEPDGAYALAVRAVSSAGTRGPEVSHTFSLDRAAPAAPTVTAAPADPSSDRTPTWSFAGEAGASFACRLERGGEPVRDWAPCDPAGRTYDLGADGDGAYAFAVRATDAAGNTGASAAKAFTLDTAAPVAPALTATPGAAGRSARPQWAFSAEPSADTECRLRLGDADVRGWAPCTSPYEAALGGEPDGAYVFAVRATDAAGNTGEPAASAHALDRVPPAAPWFTTQPGPVGNGRTPSWSFAAEAGTELHCREGEGDWAACASPRRLDLAGRSDGTYALAVRAVDAAGNESLAAVSRHELDTTPSAVQITAGPGALGRLRTPAWSFSGEAGATLECRLTHGAATVADWRDCPAPWTFDLAGLADGTFTFAARATDPAGNVGPVADAAYVLDTTRPAAPKIDRRPAAATEDVSPTWRFFGETGATFACRVERKGGATVRSWAPCVSPFTADLRDADPGEYRMLVRATDPAGNVSVVVDDAFALAEEERAAEQPRAPERGAGEPSGEPSARAAEPAAAAAPGVDAPDDDATVAGPAAGADGDERPRDRGAVKRAAAARRRPPDPAGTPDRAPVRAPAADAAARERDDVGGGGAPREAVRKLGEAAGKAARAVATAVTEHPDKSVFPGSLILLVVGFIGVQNRIDRSDPKLALAPAHADEDLEFTP